MSSAISFAAPAVPFASAATRSTRRILVALFALVLGAAAALWGAGAATAAPVFDTQGGITYQADNANIAAGATVVSYDYEVAGPDPVLLSTVTIAGQDYVVTSIAANVFNHAGLDSVTLPSGLLHIGNYAFAGNNLTSISLPASLLTIGTSAFSSNSIISVTIPDSLESIGDSVFSNNALTSLSLGANVETIGSFAFAFNSIGSLVIPDSVLSIGNSAFASNASLSSLTLGDSLLSIGDGAFHSTVVTALVIPDSVLTIGEVAFYGNPLTTLALGDSLQSVGTMAFSFNSLSSLTVPASVTSIGSQAFSPSAGTLEHVSFLGAAPSTFTARMSGGSLGSWTSTIVHYPSAHAVSGGFSTPLWQEYQAVPHPALILDLGGHGSLAPVEVLYGTVPTSLPTDPSASGWIFEGWFLDEDLTVPAVLSDPLLADLTLYAAWSADPAAVDDDGSELADTGADETLALLLAGGGILILGIGALVVVRRHRAGN